MSTLALLLVAHTAVSQAPIAVLPVAEDARAAAIDEGLRAGLRQQDRFTPQPADRTAAYLTSAAELGVSCAPDDSGCLGKLAVLAEASALLVPRTEGDALIVRLIVVGEDEREASRPLGADARASAREAALILVAPDKARGRLSVNVTPDGAVVEVDGTDVGTAPLANPVAVDPGTHVVRARHTGFDGGETTIDVPFAGEATATIELVATSTSATTETSSQTQDPETTTTTTTTTSTTTDGGGSPLATTGLVLGGAGGGLTLIGLASALVFESLVISTFDELKQGRSDKETVNGMVVGAQVSWVGAMLGAGLAVVGAGLFAAGALSE